ncbi:MAG TPA: hypothetical protein VH833_00485 [Gemmatimonadales bacterium]|jgi:hypothetical protein
MSRRLARTLLVAAVALVSAAHVGSPDTVFQGSAGPYDVRVIVRPPGIVPGLAEISVRVLSGEGVRSVAVLPLRGGRPTALEPPPDSAKPVPGDARLYSAQLWLMESGAYSIRVDVAGTAGAGSVIVPVNSIATRRLGFDTPLAAGLLGLGLLLFIGALTIVGAAVRESVLSPGEEPDTARRRRSWWVRVAAVGLLGLGVYGGKLWWDGADASHAQSLYQPMQVTTTVAEQNSASTLRIAITDSEWLGRQYSPLIPDHGKLMHLFLVRQDLGTLAHLHPLMRDSSTFEAALPPLAPGNYRLYADVVHESGFTQTLLDSVTIPAAVTRWRPSDPDDSWWSSPQSSAVSSQQTVQLEDGAAMVWVRDSTTLFAGRDVELKFAVTGRDGRPAALEPYMGMMSHAVVTREDGSVFVHLHPAGTIAMASQLVYALRVPEDTVRGRLGARITAAEGQAMQMGPMPGGVVSFPYAFPKPGLYRVWVQVKRGGQILTGRFDADVR